jgi:hypothetical protein
MNDDCCGNSSTYFRKTSSFFFLFVFICWIDRSSNRRLYPVQEEFPTAAQRFPVDYLRHGPLNKHFSWSLYDVVAQHALDAWHTRRNIPPPSHMLTTTARHRQASNTLLPVSLKTI